MLIAITVAAIVVAIALAIFVLEPRPKSDPLPGAPSFLVLPTDTNLHLTSKPPVGIATDGVKPYEALPGPSLWPFVGNMLQTLAFLKQDAHPHHVLWTSFANKHGGIYRHCAPIHSTMCWPEVDPGWGVPACMHPHILLLANLLRLHIPGHRFVVVSDPDILPAIIGRPGLPKWAAYENVVPVRGLCPKPAGA